MLLPATDEAMVNDLLCAEPPTAAARPHTADTGDDALPRLLTSGGEHEKRNSSRPAAARHSSAARYFPACLSTRRAGSPSTANQWRDARIEGRDKPSSSQSDGGEELPSLSPQTSTDCADSLCRLGPASAANGVIDLRWEPWDPVDCVAQEHDEIFDVSASRADGSTTASGNSSFADGCTSPRLCNELVPAAVATWLACSLDQAGQVRSTSRSLEDAEASLWGRTRTTPSKAACSAPARTCRRSIDLQRGPWPVLPGGSPCQVPPEATKSSRPPPPARVASVQSYWETETHKSRSFNPSSPHFRFRKAVWCVLAARWLMKPQQVTETCPRNLSRVLRNTTDWPADAMVQLIDLDLGRTFTGETVVLQRRGWIRMMLLHHVNSDPVLGYCQGMTLVAAIFAAASHSEVEAYGRFSAFLGQFRSLWLPGFPLLRAAARHFERIVEAKAWHKHLLKHGVDTSMYLPQALLTLFGCWLPLPTILECLELLETRQLAGLVAMAVAVLDLASARLLEQRCMEDLMFELQALRNFPPTSRLLLTTAQTILRSLEAVSFLASCGQSSKSETLNFGRTPSWLDRILTVFWTD